MAQIALEGKLLTFFLVINKTEKESQFCEELGNEKKEKIFLNTQTLLIVNIV